MKQYKIGDTIYIKDQIVAIDTDPCTYSKYCTIDKRWVSNTAIVDELPTSEPVKPVLPKDVADEMDLYKAASCALSTYLKDTALNATEAKATHQYLYSYLSDNLLRDIRVKTLVNAWCSGYTVEKESVYNLILGFDPDESDRRLCNALYKNHGELSIDAATDTYDLRGDDDYQFTQEEIDKYNKSFWIKNLDLNDYKVEVRTDED